VVKTFPDVFIESLPITDEEQDSGVDFLFDYETGQHVMNGSVLSECNDLRKVRQFIQNVLRTPANTYKDYVKGEKETFGLSIYNYIGQRKLPAGYINSELKREVTENLLRHPMIVEVKDWNAKRERRGLNISFTVVLKSGNVISIADTVDGVT